MKKLLFLLALVFTIQIPLNAITLEYTNDYFLPYGIYTENLNNDPEEQAEMLKVLGLFSDTENGLDLDQSITRCEAAVILARFLGEEGKVKTGKWKHPFIDVPKWAEKYIGWLYQSGITKGVSANRYGSYEKVTYWQFATFLSRACTDSDDFISNGIGLEKEQELSEINHVFLRGSVVGLLTRVLNNVYYTKNNSFMYMALFLAEKNVFTAEQLGEASWGVIPSNYYELSDNELHRVVGGVSIVKCPEKGLYITRDAINSELEYFYASRVTVDNKVELFQIDLKTMEACRIGEYVSAGCKGLDYMGSAGDRDYFIERYLLGDGLRCGALMYYDKEKLSVAVPASELWGGYAPYVYEDGMLTTENALALIGGDCLYIILGESISRYNIDKGTQMKYFDGKSIVTQLVSGTETIISCIEASSGLTVDSYMVQQDLEDYSSAINGDLYGVAGLYKLDTETGRLKQITERPVSDITNYKNDSRTIILTYNIRKPVTGMVNHGGDQIILIEDDGTEKVLLGNVPEHGLAISGFTQSLSSVIGFYTAQAVGMQCFDTYNYNLLSDGSIIVTDYSSGRPENEINPADYKSSYINKEQARLDALGY